MCTGGMFDNLISLIYTHTTGGYCKDLEISDSYCEEIKFPREPIAKVLKCQRAAMTKLLLMQY